jgi:UDP-2,4-diacetamido-2,4,6-trideoxy-beta-L-altropyranose hydrolase
MPLDRPPHLIVRADATKAIGSGHAMRCLALAEEWRERGGTVQWVGRIGSGRLRERIEGTGAELGALGDADSAAHDLESVLRRVESSLGRGGQLWVALDGYAFDGPYQRSIRQSGAHTVVIDDRAHHAQYSADVLLNQNLGAENLRYNLDPGTCCLLGPRYVLLRSEFRRWRAWRRDAHAGPRRVLITMGGSDSAGLTGMAVEAVATSARSVAIDVVVAADAAPDDRLERLVSSVRGGRVLRDVEDMAALMAAADIAVSAGGSTCWELCFMQLPSAVVSVGDEQMTRVDRLARSAAVLSLGGAGALTVDRIRHAVTDLVDGPDLRRDLAGRGRAIVDGLGAGLVARCLCEGGKAVPA